MIIVNLDIASALAVELTNIQTPSGKPGKIESINGKVVADASSGTFIGTALPFKSADGTVDLTKFIAYPPDGFDPDPAAVTVYQVDPDALIGPGEHFLPPMQFGVHWTPEEAATAELNLGTIMKKSDVIL